MNARGLSRAWRGKRKFTLLGRGGRLVSTHLYRRVRVSFLPSPSVLLPTAILSPSRPPPFAVAFDPAVLTCRCAFYRSCRVRPDGSRSSPPSTSSLSPATSPTSRRRVRHTRHRLQHLVQRQARCRSGRVQKDRGWLVERCPSPPRSCRRCVACLVERFASF